jgi:hypothetical protein
MIGYKSTLGDGQIPQISDPSICNSLKPRYRLCVMAPNIRLTTKTTKRISFSQPHIKLSYYNILEEQTYKIILKLNMLRQQLMGITSFTFCLNLLYNRF